MPQPTLNKKDFVRRAKSAHGDTYGYSKTSIEPQVKIVTITCLKHGDFSQDRNAHCRGQGCPSCWKERQRAEAKRFTFEEWEQKARATHGDTYEYVKSSYNGTQKKVTVVCKKHGPFSQVACMHVLGQGCNKCAIEKRADEWRLTTSDFVERAVAVHGDRYDYNETVYKTALDDVNVRCKEHGYFKVKATKHLTIGQGCPTCARGKPRKRRAAMLRPTRACMRKRKNLTQEEWIARAKEVHGDDYDYSTVVYVESRKKVAVKCGVHGVFEQEAASHLQGSGCPTCCRSVSVAEELWLDSLGVTKRQVKVGRYKVDGLDPDNRVVYEFLGDFWHGNPAIYPKEKLNAAAKKTFGYLYDRTIARVREIESMGYRVVTIWESDWYKKMGFASIPRLTKKVRATARGF